MLQPNTNNVKSSFFGSAEKDGMEDSAFSKA